MTERGMRPGSIPLNKLVLVPDLAILATVLGLLLCARGGGAVEVGRELKPLGFGGRGCRSQLLAGRGVGRSAEAFFGAPRWSVTTGLGLTSASLASSVELQIGLCLPSPSAVVVEG